MRLRGGYRVSLGRILDMLRCRWRTMVERYADVRMSLPVLSSEGAAEDGTVPDHQVIVGQPSPFRTCLLRMKSVLSATTRRSLDPSALRHSTSRHHVIQQRTRAGRPRTSACRSYRPEGRPRFQSPAVAGHQSQESIAKSHLLRACFRTVAE